MALRRGFKSEANWYASSLRKELDIASHLPLCPWHLARHLGFPVFPLNDYRTAAPEAVAYLRTLNGQKDFSAVTLAAGQERFIVHNDAHERKRQAADISHELAHGLLLHPPMKIFDPSDHDNVYTTAIAVLKKLRRRDCALRGGALTVRTLCMGSIANR